ncbi:MAG: glycosyl transferase family 1 [Treponema sp. CETP13]|nr:MAG: glycosyl transferase family 1 [Treponema sp. CETP13]
MKLGIDIIGSDHGRSGIGSYVQALVKNLPDDASISYELFGAEVDRYTFKSNNEHIRYKGLSLPDSISGDRLWHMFRMKKFIQNNNYDALLCVAGSKILPGKMTVPTIAVINGVVSNIINSKNDIWTRKMLLSNLKKVTKIIAASQFIRKDLINLGIEKNRIEVVHNGIDHSMFYPRENLNNETVLIKPFAIKRPYIIYASRLSNEGKKHVELINAFNMFKKNTGLPHRLVLAGNDDLNSEKIHLAASLSPYASDIFLTGYFPHENLPELYCSADACIFPSIIEGVGLPVLEAMASGVPVAVAKAGALPEIAGDGALYFNPDDTEEFAHVIEEILTNQKKRQSLIEFSTQWTERFSWKRTGEKTLQVIKNAVEEFAKSK